MRNLKDFRIFQNSHMKNSSRKHVETFSVLLKCSNLYKKTVKFYNFLQNFTEIFKVLKFI